MAENDRTGLARESDLATELAFKSLQARLSKQYRSIFADRKAPRTVMVVPSMSLDQDVLAQIAGVHHYEERMLCLLLLLRLPHCRVIFLAARRSPRASSTIISIFFRTCPTSMRAGVSP